MSSLSRTLRKEFEELMAMGVKVEMLHQKMEKIQILSLSQAPTSPTEFEEILASETTRNVTKSNGIRTSGHKFSRGTQMMPSMSVGKSVATQTDICSEEEKANVEISAASVGCSSNLSRLSPPPKSKTFPELASGITMPPSSTVKSSTSAVPPPPPLPASNIPVPSPLPVPTSNIPAIQPMPVPASSLPVPPPLPSSALYIPVPPPLPVTTSNIPIPPPMPEQDSNIPVPPPLPVMSSNIPVPPPMPGMAPDIPVPPPLTGMASNIPVPPPLPGMASNIPVPPPLPGMTSNIPAPPPIPGMPPNIPAPPPMPGMASNIPAPPPLPGMASNIPVPPPLPGMTPNIPVPPPLPGIASNIPAPPPLPGMTSNIPAPPPIPGMPPNIPAPPPMPGMPPNIPAPPPMPGMPPNIPAPPPLPGMASNIPAPPPMPGIASNIPAPPPMPGIASNIPAPPPLPGMASNIPAPPPMPGMAPNIPAPPPLPGTASNIPAPPPLPGIASNIPVPPPLPGIASNIPAPPPLPGIASNIPAPPPMPGMAPNIPAPPPLPGMASNIPAPPPLPVTNLSIPPPPPWPVTPNTGAPPAPPLPVLTPRAPPMPGAQVTPALPMMTDAPVPSTMTPSSGVPPPPPFGTPVNQYQYLASGHGPTPFPPPPQGGWNAGRSAFRKSPVTLGVNMKPLFWTRIISTTNTPPQYNGFGTEPKNEAALWKDLEETKIEDIDEFVKLFSRVPVQKKAKEIKKIDTAPKVQAAKILDSKRFQSVGILAASLHLEIFTIEEAVYGFDATYVSLETLQRIYDVQATSEELTLIKDHVRDKPDIPLDKPEQFLYELSQISFFGERVSCLVFQNEFEHALSSIQSKLCILRTVCQELMTSDSLKGVFSVILTLGNLMNGGNMMRGQADGFGLDILPRLRDVKSTDSAVTLLHFIVRETMKKTANPGKDPIPVPEPGDITKAGQVVFDDLSSDIEKIQKDLKGSNSMSAKVISESPEQHIEPFKSKMDAFLESACRRVKELVGSLEESKELFLCTLRFYQFQCKGVSKLTDVTPSDFFSLWLPFCNDFKNIWLQESEAIAKKKLKEARDKHTVPVQTKKADTTGLKKLIARKKNSEK